MDFKVNEIQQPVPVQQTQSVQQTDDSFRFMLASNIEEAGLAERLNLLMEEIVMQGDKIVKRMDVRDMKRRSLSVRNAIRFLFLPRWMRFADFCLIFLRRSERT